jgi:hypothetical protein
VLTPVTISKTSFPEHLDFEVLREAGLRHLAELCGDRWTDFNLHDPGITILDVLVYALTDLGYRTQFPIEDLVARSPEDRAAGTDTNFFTPNDVLTCTPVTLTDLRRLLVDVPGVKNAWIDTAEDAEVPLWVDPERERLQYGPPEDLAGVDPETCRVRIGGLYTLCIELDDLDTTDACGRPDRPTGEVLRAVRRVLARHRNLCEDVLDVLVLEDEHVGLCADVEIDPEADPETVLLDVYLAVQEFLSPTLRFYSLAEMQERGKSPAEIFAGRPRTLDSHGFVDLDELEATQRRRQIYASDVYRIMMNVDGVRAVRGLVLTGYVDDQSGDRSEWIATTQGERWCLPLTPKHRPLMDLHRSPITFHKGPLSFRVDADEVEQRYRERRRARTKAKLDPYQLDRSVPEGRHRDLADYTSVQHDFPLVYGTGEYGPDVSGLDPDARRIRIAQARQLKAFLLFFDQILASYLAQLANLRALFAMDPGVDRTYFAQPLVTADPDDPSTLVEHAPNVAELLINPRDCGDELREPGGDGAPQDYPPFLQHITESGTTFDERRNEFLDHLLARFAESFTDYVLLTFDLEGRRASERIIRDKACFLRDYPEVSRTRGRAFDYTDADGVWDSENVSGLQKRVSRLLGFENEGAEESADLCAEDYRRRALCPFDVVDTASGVRFQLVQGDAVLAESRSVYPDTDAARAAFDAFTAHARSERNVRRVQYGEGSAARYTFTVVGSDGRVLAEAAQTWTQAEERDHALLEMIAFVRSPAVESSIEQATECYFAALRSTEPGVDPLSSPPLLLAETGFPAKEQAEEDGGRLLERAREPDAYDPTSEAEDAFRFGLVGEDGTRIAGSPRRFGTAQERDDRMQALLFRAGTPDVQFRTPGEPGDYTFEIRDDNGTLQLVSPESDPSSRDARRRCRRAQRLARYRTYFRTVDDFDGEGDGPYSFVLVDTGGRVLANHPRGYATDCARDKALDALIAAARRDDDARTDVRPAETEEGFRFVLQNDAGEEVLVSTDVYATNTAATDALGQMRARAQREEHYRRFAGEDVDAPYGFELLDADGDSLARHPDTYEREDERDLALTAVVNLVCPSALDCEIGGTPGRYTFELYVEPGFAPDAGERILLESTSVYPDRQAAEDAYDGAVDLASRRSNYRLMGSEEEGWTFDIAERDDDGTWQDPVATHPAVLDTAAERDAVVDLTLAYLGTLGVVTGVENPVGAFFFEVATPEGDVLLRGTETHPSEDDATAACDAVLDLATEPDRYVMTSDGPAACPYGFAVHDAGTRVAVHPRTYARPGDRDAALDRVVARLRSGETMPDDDLLGSVPATGRVDRAVDWRVEVAGLGGTVLLEGAQRFATKSEALRDFRERILPAALNPARYARSYDNATCTYDARLVDVNGTTLAETPGPFDRRAERDARIDDVLFLLRPPDVTCAVRGTGCGFAFTLDVEVEGEAVHFRGLQRHADGRRVRRARNDAARWLADADRLSVPDDGPYADSLLLTNPSGVPIAVAEEPETTDPSDLAADLVAFLQTAAGVDPELTESSGAYRYRLHAPSNPSDAGVQLESVEAFPTSEAAWDACNRLAERLQNRDHVFSITGDTHCTFGFGVEDDDGDPMALHPKVYPTPEARNDAVDDALRIAGREGFHLVEHILLRPRSAGQAAPYYFELRDPDAGAVLLRSRATYADEEAAARALRAVVDALLAGGEDAVRPTRPRTEPDPVLYAFRVPAETEDGTSVVGEPPDGFDTESARREAVDDLLAFVGDVFDPESEEEPDLSPFLQSFSGEEGDRLLPIDAACSGEQGVQCPLRVDPYSFRATVVLPAWPRRFRERAFRDFIERTIRTEAPAHVFLRICWVDAEQMCAFEAAYRPWLETLVLPSTATGGPRAAAERHCRAQAALDALIDVLGRLRNVYPPAVLRDCDTTQGTPVTLNQTLLGSATANDHGND